MSEGKTGFQFAYSVEQTTNKGLGVFARERIPKGSVVWRHLPGVFLVYDEPSFRALIATLSTAEAIYELTHVHALEDFPGCLIRALDDGILINHASGPTLVTNDDASSGMSWDVGARGYLQAVTEALVNDRYSLVATRDIAIGEELTNDYLSESAGPPYYDELCTRFGVSEDYLYAG